MIGEVRTELALVNPSASDTKMGRSLRPRTIVVVGLVLLAAYIVGIMLSMGSYDTLVAVIIGPLLFLISLPILARQATRERDGRVFWILLIGLALKLLGAIAQIYVSFTAYAGVADATDYFREGLRLAPLFRAGNFVTGFHPLVGTNFVRVLSGIVLAVIGPSRTGAFLLFSWLGFWGLFFLYRAFRIAVPEGRPFTYARLLFFLPSLLYWPSALGKDAWMVFGLGIAAFGAARMLQGRMWRGLLIVSLGLTMDIMVRPHVVALFGVALAGGYLLRRPRADLRQLAPVVKTLSAIILLTAAFLLVRRSDSFLKESGFKNPTNLTSSLDRLTSSTYGGGSSFAPTPATSPRGLATAFVTVLFRPILTDAHSFQGTLAALEGTFLLGFALIRFRWIIAALRSMRRQPYVGLALVFTLVFVVAFSSIANFGILVRQRSTVLPFFLVLFTVPPKRKLFSRDEQPEQLREDTLRA